MSQEMTAFYRFACLIILFRKCLTEVLQEECEVHLTNLNGTITSLSSTPNQTDSPSKFSCKWNIQLKDATKHRHVELQFTVFVLSASLPHCSDGDYVELFIGCKNSTSIGKFCGHTPLPIIYSFDHCLQVVLHIHSAAGGRTRPEFSAFYNQRLLSKAVSPEYYGCGKDLHSKARHGNVFSPHWPLPYPNYVDCVWHIITGPRLHVKLIFYDFDVRLTHLCEVDFVKVNAGAEFDRRGYTSDKRNCGRRGPFALTLREDSIYIHFKSGPTSGNRGFMAGFLAYEIE
ncbi:CUB domain-containing protein 2-like isoform X2 [Acropora muricata]|uniref:CUB domain-containing protein 2-like isoform X2 n=1 Tax=Acropora muricata TaxID=159855 RepID=UPI0034E3BC33